VFLFVLQEVFNSFEKFVVAFTRLVEKAYKIIHPLIDDFVDVDFFRYVIQIGIGRVRVVIVEFNFEYVMVKYEFRQDLVFFT